MTYWLARPCRGYLIGKGTTIRHFFLESPWLLIPTLVVAEYVLLVLWLRRRTPRTKRAMLVGLLFLIVLPLVQAAVRTPQEQLRDTCAALVRAVEAGNIREIGSFVDSAFAVGDMNRASFLAGVEKALADNAVENAKLSVREITLDGDRAEVRFKINCRVVTPNFDQPDVNSLWQAVFRREGDGWRLIAVEPQSTPLFPVSRLEQLLP